MILWFLFCLQLTTQNPQPPGMNEYFYGPVSDATLSTVLCGLQDRDGYIWTGGWEGLQRFDGVQRRFFNYRSTPIFGTNGVRALFQDERGTIWIGTNGHGLVFYEDGVFKRKAQFQMLDTMKILALSQDSNNRIWIGTSAGIYFHERGQVFQGKNDLLTNVSINSFYESPSGRIWFGTYIKGAMFYENGEFELYEPPKKLPSSSVRCFLEDKQGRLLLGTSNGFHIIEGDQVQSYLQGHTIANMLEDKYGCLWIATDNGIYRLHKDKLEVHKSNKLKYQVVISMWPDNDGGFWVGSYKNGLFHLQRGDFAIYSSAQGLEVGAVNAVIPLSNGSFFLVGDRGCGFLENDNIRLAPFNDQLTERTFMALEYGPNHYLLASAGKVYEVKNNLVQIVDPQASIQFIRHVSKGQNGDVWVSWSKGLALLKDGKYQLFTEQQGYPQVMTISSFTDSQGNLWAGTDGAGVYRINEQGSTIFTTAHGLPSNIVFNIMETDDDTIWVSTNHGIARLVNERFSAVTQDHGLKHSAYFYMVEAQDHSFWMTSNTDLIRLETQQLKAITEEKLKYIDQRSYGKERGLFGACTPIGIGAEGADGRLYIPTTEGIAVIRPQVASEIERKPMVHTEQVLVDGTLVTETEVPLGSRELEFFYTAFDYQDPEKLNFMIRLKGFDEEWRDRGNRRSMNFTRFSPGRYILEVKAVNSNGVWSEVKAFPPIEIPPYFYQTSFGKVLIAMGLGILIIMMFNLRVRQIRHRERILEALIEKRTNKLHQAKQQIVMQEKMASLGTLTAGVAHEINNPNNFITGALATLRLNHQKFKDLLFQLADDPEVQEELGQWFEKFNESENLIARGSQRINHIVSNLKILTRLDESESKRVDLSEGLIAAQVFLEATHDWITFDTQIQGDLFLLCCAGELNQVFVHLLDNACHSIEDRRKRDGEDSPALVRVEAYEQEGMIHIRITDTGLGIEKEVGERIFEAFYTTRKIGEGSGLGLYYSYQILKKHKGHLRYETNPEETSFILEIPLNEEQCAEQAISTES